MGISIERLKKLKRVYLVSTSQNRYEPCRVGHKYLKVDGCQFTLPEVVNSWSLFESESHYQEWRDLQNLRNNLQRRMNNSPACRLTKDQVAEMNALLDKFESVSE